MTGSAVSPATSPSAKADAGNSDRHITRQRNSAKALFHGLLMFFSFRSFQIKYDHKPAENCLFHLFNHISFILKYLVCAVKNEGRKRDSTTGALPEPETQKDSPGRCGCIFRGCVVCWDLPVPAESFLSLRSRRSPPGCTGTEICRYSASPPPAHSPKGSCSSRPGHRCAPAGLLLPW